MFGKVICTIYIPEPDKVERVPKSELISSDEFEAMLSSDEIVSIAAAGKVFDALNNYTRTIGEDVLLAPLDSAVTPLPHQLDTLKRAIGGSTVRMLLADVERSLYYAMCTFINVALESNYSCNGRKSSCDCDIA